MKFILPISPKYVSHWGLWEAVREIYQNALDAMSSDENIHGGIDYDSNDEAISIFTDGGRLEPSNLILGNTSKADDPSLRGKFGEGFKLALLVLARSGFRVEIFNNNEQWTAVIEHNPEFDADLLTISIEEHPYPIQGVKFKIYGVSVEQWDAIQFNLHPMHKESILDDAKEVGRVYVGGLFVGDMKRFKCGYTFEPGTIKLDRDRGMIDGFDLAYETSRMHSAAGGPVSKKLIEEGAPDVEYLINHATKASPATSYYASSYFDRYGYGTVPVSTQEEIKAVTAAGLSWTLVTDHAKQLLRLVHSWFIPNAKSPAQRLREFQQRYRYSLNAEQKQELEEIIEQMEPTRDKVPSVGDETL